MTEHFDVLIVGAGISGIGSAWHLSQHCPDKSFAILEGRDAIGGTWDLFRYPGIRSDSDMYTLGYNFKPWLQNQVIANGGQIRNYIQEAAVEGGFQNKIQFGRKVASAIGSGISRFVPLLGASAVAAYAYYDTAQVGNTAFKFFSLQIEEGVD